jgi:hypothetical protein
LAVVTTGIAGNGVAVVAGLALVEPAVAAALKVAALRTTVSREQVAIVTSFKPLFFGRLIATQ